MGNIVSPWRYEIAAADAIRPDDQRRTAILRYALMGGCLPDFAGGPVTLDSGLLDQSRDRCDGPMADMTERS
jgi:hypothetical protein